MSQSDPFEHFHWQRRPFDPIGTLLGSWTLRTPAGVEPMAEAARDLPTKAEPGGLAALLFEIAEDRVKVEEGAAVPTASLGQSAPAAKAFAAPAPAAAEVGGENGSNDPTASVSSTGDQRINGLLSGIKWADGSISYSDPNRVRDYQASHSEDFTDFSQISANQLRTVHAVLNTLVHTQPAGGIGFSVEGFTNLAIAYAGAGSGAGTIRLANVSDTSTAFAYFPSEAVEGGDVFFGGSGRQPTVGNYDHQTIIHELGHSLGLKHGHETNFYGALPGNYDSLEFSVMTYRTFVGDNTTGYDFELWGAPQTFMMLDIAALQYMYGADFTTNGGNTPYTWNPLTGQALVNGVAALTPGGNRIFETIWDGGGTDAYNLSNYTSNLRIDLAPGGYSTFSSTQLAYLGGGPNGGYARGNVFNALQYQGDARSLIENALGGSGNDIINGNAANNILRGNAGNDKFRGLAGNDTLRGGLGNDDFSGGVGADVLLGGPGADACRFANTDSTPAARDTLGVSDGAIAFEGAGAASGDKFDFRNVDANTSAANDQAFLFGTATGAGRLWLTNSGSDTLINGNTDADATIEFQIAIEDETVVALDYTNGDFLL